MDESTRSMIRNLEEKTGKPLDHWIQAVKTSGVDKPGKQVAWLKESHGFTHGYANLVVQAAKGALAPPAPTEDGEAAVFSGPREGVRPVYDALRQAAIELGDDVQLAPKKAYVSLRRKKQFALAQPTTRRLDLGLNLKGQDPEGRLEASGSFNAMCTHRIRLENPEDLDAEVKKWLRKAYDAAG
jgi:predicted transport protein